MNGKFKQNISNSKLNSHLIFYNNSIEQQQLQQQQQNIQNNLGLIPLHQTNNNCLPVPIITNDGTIMNEWYMPCEPDQNLNNINQNNNTNSNNNVNTTTTTTTTNNPNIFSNLYSTHARTPIINYS